MINNVCREISEFIEDDNLIILRSTVEVGTTTNIKSTLKKIKTFKFLSVQKEQLRANMIELRNLPQIVGAETLEVALRVSQFLASLHLQL